LPHSGFGKRRPLCTLTEAPKGEGKRYIPSEEGQMFRGTILEGKRIGLREDTTEIWLVETSDESSYVDLATGRQMVTRNVNLVVEAQVTFDSTRKDYWYEYILHSLKGSPREVRDFEVVFDPSLPFSDFTAPKTKPNPWIAWAWRRERNPEYWERAGRPLRWYGFLTFGESLAGFSFRSPILPGIVHCWSMVIIPHARLVFLGGNTLGPVAPPDTFDPQKFLGRLSSMIDESLKEGWIEDGNVVQDLEKGLESARGAVKSGDEKQLESTLRDLLEKVEKEKGRSLLSEAYALLKYNVQYWLDQSN